MVATVDYNAFWFIHLKVVHKNLDLPLREKLDRLLLDIKADLRTGQFRQKMDHRLPAIFDLRLEALRWLAGEPQNFLDLMNREIFPYVTTMKQSKRLSALVDRILVGLQLNQRVMAKLFRQPGMDRGASDIPRISYQDLSAVFSMTLPHEVATALADWVKSSLYMEYMMLAALCIYDENLPVSKDTMTELAHWLDDSIQAYAALAVELRMLDIDEVVEDQSRTGSSKGAALFRKMLEDKNKIRQHVRSGGELADLKDRFRFANPLSFKSR